MLPNRTSQGNNIKHKKPQYTTRYWVKHKLKAKIIPAFLLVLTNPEAPAGLPPAQTYPRHACRLS